MQLHWGKILRTYVNDTKTIYIVFMALGVKP